MLRVEVRASWSVTLLIASGCARAGASAMPPLAAQDDGGLTSERQACCGAVDGTPWVAVAETPLASRLGITFDQPTDPAVNADAVHDPWRFWIFNLGVNGNVQGQETQSEKSVEGSLTANRTTEAWKIELGVEYDYSHETFTLEEGEIFTAVQRELDAGTAVESLVLDLTAA